MSEKKSGATRAHPPVARQQPEMKIVHGTLLSDEYAWLRADNWQEVLADPASLPAEIEQHLRAENAYSETVLAPMADLRQTLQHELRARIKEDDSRVAWPDGPWQYYTRHRTGGQHEIICRSPREKDAPEEILLDADVLAKGKPFFDLGDASHSPDHARLAWSADVKGSELYEIRVKDIATGKALRDVVRRTDGTIVWSLDASAFYYVRVDNNHRTAQVFRHALGTAQSADVLVVEEIDPAWFVSLRRSQSERYAIVSMHDHDSAECHLIDLRHSDAKAVCIAPRRTGVRYEAEPQEDTILIVTNADGAEDFKIVEAPLAQSGPEHWRDVVPHERGRMIINGSVFARWMVRMERINSLPRLVVRNRASGEDHVIDFEEEAYALRLEHGLEYDTDVLRFAYSSMTTPEEVWDYNMATRTRVLRKRQTIPSGHDPANYVTKRLYATAADGERVPISLLARADHKGPAPTLIYGYGAYGNSLSAGFSANRLSLVDRGFVFAIAHIRGGTDKGWHWYENGKLANKPNSFSDFVACTRHLISTGWSDPAKIVAQGGSAGGLLMGAVVNLAPELYCGIIADVPFVDVINTMMDTELPLTPPEWLEWGNPITDAQAFKTMLSYSPYDNVRATHYPAILALGGVSDPRVTYWEPAKWVARLRNRMTSGGPVILRTNMDAGHGGASGRFNRLEQVALEQAFAIAAVEGTLTPT